MESRADRIRRGVQEQQTHPYTNMRRPNPPRNSAAEMRRCGPRRWCQSGTAPQRNPVV